MKKIKKTTVFFICLISFFILFQSSEKAHAVIDFPGYIMLYAFDIHDNIPVANVTAKLTSSTSSTHTLTTGESGMDVELARGGTYNLNITHNYHRNICTMPTTIEVLPSFQWTYIYVYFY